MAAKQASVSHSPHALMELFARNRAMMLLIRPTDGSIVEANPAATSFYGYPREVLCSMKIWDINQLPREEVLERMRTAAQTQQNRFIFPHRLADGQIRTVEVYTSPIESQGEELLFSIVHDVTEQRQAEKELQESERRFRTLFEEAPTAIGISRNGVALFVNRALREMLGYENAADLVGRPVVEHWGLEGQRVIEERLRKRALGVPDSSTFEGTVMRKDGSSLSVEVAVASVDLPDGPAAVGFLADISKRKQAEQALWASERQFSTAFEMAATGMAMVSTDGRWLKVNPALCEIVGYTADQLCGMSFQDLTHPDDKETDLRNSQRLLAGEIESVQTEKRYFHKGRNIIWILLTVSLVRDQQGRPLHFVAQTIDITKRKQAEEALRESEARFRSIVEKTKAGYFFIDRDGCFQEVNEAWLQMHHYPSAEEVIGKHFSMTQVEESLRKATSIVEMLLDSAPVINGEFDRRCRDGAIGYHEFTASPVLHEGRVIGLEGFLIDTTERKSAEAALRESEERYRMLVELSPDAIIVHREGKVAFANNSASALFGASKAEDLVGRDIDGMIHPDFRETVRERSRRIQYEDQPAPRQEQKCLRPDGSSFDIDVSSAPITWNGKRSSLTMIRDISERKRTEEALRASERQLRSLLAAAERHGKELELLDQVRKSISADLDLPAIFRIAVESIVNAFGYKQAGIYIEHEGFLELRHQVGNTRVIEKIPITQGVSGRVFRSGRAELVENVQSDPDFIGAIDGVVSEVCVPVFDEGRPVGVLNVESTNGIALTKADLHTLTAVGEELSIALSKVRLYANARASEKRFATIFEKTPLPMALSRWTDGAFVDVNEEWTKTFGFAKEEAVGKTQEQLGIALDPTVGGLIREELKRGSGSVHALELALPTRSGEKRVFSINIETTLLNDEPFFLQTAVDLTERKKAEEKVRESEEKWRSIVNASPDAILTLSLDGTIQQASTKILELWGYDPERDVLGHSVFDFIESPDRERAKSVFAEVLSGKGHGSTQYTSRRQDGTRILLELDREVLRDSRGAPTGMVVVLRDITGRVAMENQLRQALKMESVGRLAGGVAHDFNNHLQVILGYAEIATSSLSPEARLYRELQQISDAARRSADLTRQLLAFARRQDVVPQVLNLNSAVARTLKMLRRLIGEDIQLVWEPGQDLWHVKIDPAQLDQILTNLATNSRDAIPGAGALTVATSNVTLDESWCQTHLGWLAGQYVLLSVSDTGKGMSRETLEHVFEPFFTTKDVGHGTGLGLATVYGIVKQNSGFVDVQSQLGSGTTFGIYLPRTPDGTTDVAIEAEGATPRGRETVLIVEDEENILRLAKDFLEQMGYTVFVASTPAAAIAFAQGHRGRLDLLITDVVMPELNGKELHSRLSTLRPGLKVLFMSGYTADLISQRGIVEQGTNFLHKPFTMRALASKAREAIDAT